MTPVFVVTLSDVISLLVLGVVVLVGLCAVAVSVFRTWIEQRRCAHKRANFFPGVGLYKCPQCGKQWRANRR